MHNGYWRHGPVLNNAVSAVDMALWDLKAKRAGMPLYDLIGGKVREAAAVYQHADGRDLDELCDHVRQIRDEGIDHIRLRVGGGSAATRESGEVGGKAYGGPASTRHRPDGSLPGEYYDPRSYIRATLDAFARVRECFNDDVELLHDVHERLTPSEAITFARALEPFRLYYLEDALSIEDSAWFERLRAATTTPLAVGELFNHPAEWMPLVANRWIDFIRMHVSQMGGLTPALKLTHTAEAFGVRTAWHGPGDVSPVGHAVNLHLNLAAPNFGVQELQPFTSELRDVFPGGPELRHGYLYPNDRPGHGVDLDEDLAARFPCDPRIIEWTQCRRPDGSLFTP